MRDEPELTYTIKTLSEMIVVELSGVLNMDSAHVLHRVFPDLFSQPSGTVAFDMSQVGFVDSEGLGTLVGIQKRLTERGGRLVLIGCQEPVRNALTLTRLEVLLPNYTSYRNLKLRT